MWYWSLKSSRDYRITAAAFLLPSLHSVTQLMNLSNQPVCFTGRMKVAQFVTQRRRRKQQTTPCPPPHVLFTVTLFPFWTCIKRVPLPLSAAVLSSLSLAIIQLNSSQASAALAVRGRFLDARREGELQRQLIERAMWVTAERGQATAEERRTGDSITAGVFLIHHREHNRSVDDNNTYQQWVKTMEPIYKNIFHFTRVGCCICISSSRQAKPAQTLVLFFFQRMSVVSDSQVIQVTFLRIRLFLLKLIESSRLCFSFSL